MGVRVDGFGEPCSRSGSQGATESKGEWMGLCPMQSAKFRTLKVLPPRAQWQDSGPTLVFRSERYNLAASDPVSQ